MLKRRALLGDARGRVGRLDEADLPRGAIERGGLPAGVHPSGGMRVTGASVRPPGLVVMGRARQGEAQDALDLREAETRLVLREHAFQVTLQGFVLHGRLRMTYLVCTILDRSQP